MTAEVCGKHLVAAQRRRGKKYFCSTQKSAQVNSNEQSLQSHDGGKKKKDKENKKGLSAITYV